MLFFGKQETKRPLKVNVFENMIAHQGMLEQLPIFPYFGPAAGCLFCPAVVWL